jgi:hypothetical protein
MEERGRMVSQMVAKPTHGLVSHVGRSHQVSRQTVYRWASKGRQALSAALGQPLAVTKPEPPHAFLVLTLVIETHARYRGMQTCLREVHGIRLSVGSITRISTDAGRRAQGWLEQQRTSTPRTLALDEQDGSQRGNAPLHVIDVHSGHVWASIPPVQVDGERWTLALWYLQEQGISRLGTVRDGGRAMAEAVRQVHGEESHQRDVWHLFQTAPQVQGRLDQAVKAERERVAVIERQAQQEANADVADAPQPRGANTRRC